MMNRTYLYILAALGLSNFASACAGNTAKKSQDPLAPGQEQAAQSQVPLEQLESGKALYQSRCGGCHMLYTPDHLGPDKWPTMVESMSERSKLTPEQAESISQYLVAMSRRNDK